MDAAVMGAGAADDDGAASHPTLLTISPSHELLHALRLVQNHRDVDLIALSDSAGLLSAHDLHRPDLVVVEVEADAQLARSLDLLHDATGCPAVVITDDPSSSSIASASATRIVTPPVEVVQLITAFDEVLADQEDHGTDRTLPHSRPPLPPPETSRAQGELFGNRYLRADPLGSVLGRSDDTDRDL